ncbi:MAG: hypothetical protein ACTSYL_09470 [Candidatus Thorarchaeota archaeon]
MEQYGEREYIVTLYVVLPLVLLSFSMGALSLFINDGQTTPTVILTDKQKQAIATAFATLSSGPGRIPIGIMTKYTTEAIYYQANTVAKVFSDYNIAHPGSYVTYKAIGDQATTNKFKNYLYTTSRLHVAAHGSWTTNEKSQVDLYDDNIDATLLDQWTKIYGSCRLVFLSSCNSLGHNGLLDTTLAYKIQDISYVQAVIGYKDVANLVTASMLAEAFWTYHANGLASQDAFITARDQTNGQISQLENQVDAGVAITLAILAAIGIFGWVAALILTLIAIYSIHPLLDEMRDTVSNFEIVGANVDGLNPQPGGGGGDTPI